MPLGRLAGRANFLLGRHAADVLILVRYRVVFAVAEIGDERDQDDHRRHQQSAHDGRATSLFIFVHIATLRADRLAGENRPWNGALSDRPVGE